MPSALKLMSCDSVPRPGRRGQRQLAGVARRGRIADVGDLDRGRDRRDQVRVRVVEEVAARVDRLVVRSLLDLDERDRLRPQRVGELDDEGAVLAAAVLLVHGEAERRGLAVTRRGAVAEGVRGVGRKGPAGHVGLADHLHVALGHAAVVDRRDACVLGILDVHDLEPVLVRAGEGVLAPGELGELDVGAEVRVTAVANLVGEVLHVAHVVAVLALLRSGSDSRDGAEHQHERDDRDDTPHAQTPCQR